MKSLLELYSKASTYPDGLNVDHNLAHSLWQSIPHNASALKLLLPQIYTQLPREHLEAQLEAVKTLQTELRRYHRELGSLTSGVNEHIENLAQGIIEVGHQPLYLGGGSFVFNKLVFTDSISQTTGYSPLLFIGDHDVVQNELTIARFPQAKSAKALEVSYPVPQNMSSSPVYNLPLPPEDELETLSERIKSNYTALLKYSDIQKDRQLLQERLLVLLDVISLAYYQSQSLSEWVTRIWQMLLIHLNAVSLPMINASNQVLRKLVLPGYELLLQEENHSKFITTINAIRQTILDAGYEPGFGERPVSHVPFFIVCPECSEHPRIDPKLESPGHIIAECPQCQTKLGIEYNSLAPDLIDYAPLLLPRVDSRTFLLSYCFPVLAHVGGTGELVYHAQLYPAYKQFHPVPVFLKYNMQNYNTPWITKTANDPTLANQSLYTEEFIKQLLLYKKIPITELIPLLEQQKTTANKVLETINHRREELQMTYEQTKNRSLLPSIAILSTYLAQTFGQYAKDQQKQEVSWHWLDLALLTDIHDIAGIYKRMFREDIPFAQQLYFLGSQYH